MGKYRFRLSDMMPNAWFYKLKDMGKSRSSTNKPNSRATKTVKQSSPTPTQTTITSTNTTKLQHPKSSYVYYPTYSTEPLIRFTDPLYSSPRNHIRASDARSFTSPSRKSSDFRNRNKRTTVYTKDNDRCLSADQPIYYSVSSSELGSPESMITLSNDHRRSLEFGAELLMFDELGTWSSSSLQSSFCSCCCRISSSTADIIIDLNQHKKNHEESSSFSRKFQKLNEFDAASELELRPILTKLPDEPVFDKIIDATDLCSFRKPASRETHNIGDNIRYVMRKVKSRKTSLSDSFVIVKSSLNPLRDFQDSMMEMIQENNIKGFKDLEELLACYLSLNCQEYHPLIVEAFEQIWLDTFCST